MKLTKGGTYLLQRCEKKSLYEDEEIYVQIKAVQGVREFSEKTYLKCTCVDGIKEEANIYIELLPNSHQSSLQKNSIIMIKSFINEKHSNGAVLVLVTQYNIVKAKMQDQENKELISISSKNKTSTEIYDKIESIKKNNKMIDEKENDIEFEDKKENTFQLLNRKNEEACLIQNQQTKEKIDDNNQQNTKMIEEILFGVNTKQSRDISVNNHSTQSSKIKKELINQQENNQNNNQSSKFGEKNAVIQSDKLNKKTLLVSELKVGMNKSSFKFEGCVQTKSQIKQARDGTKHFFSRVVDSMDEEVNISFWINVDEFYDQIQVEQSYYFFGGEVNKFNDKGG